MEPDGDRRVDRLKGEAEMVQKLITVTMIGTALVLAACNTVRGAAKDVNSVANCTENTMNGKAC